MTLAINTSAVSAIASISDLVTRVRYRIDDSEFDRDEVYRAITETEAWFNRKLRAADMETTILFNVTSEITPLPADFLQMRSIFQEGTPDQPLKSMSSATLFSMYSGQAGIPCAYAIEGSDIRIAPVGDTYLSMSYYARIPGLNDSTQTNWLLGKHPDLYVNAVAGIIFGDQGDFEREERFMSKAAVIIDQINTDSMKARWGAGPLVPSGIRQVCGARA